MDIYNSAEQNVSVDDYIRLEYDVRECYDTSAVCETSSMGMRVRYYPKLQVHVYQRLVRERLERQQRESLAKQIRNAQIMTDLSIREITSVEYAGLPTSHQNFWEQVYESGPQWNPTYKYVRKPTPQEITQQRARRYDEIKNQQEISESDYNDVIPNAEKHQWEESTSGPQWDPYRVYRKRRPSAPTPTPVPVPVPVTGSNPSGLMHFRDAVHLMDLDRYHSGSSSGVVTATPERWYIKGNDGQFYPVVDEMQTLLDENAPTRTPFSQQINGEQQPRRVVFDPDGRSAIQVKYDSTSREIKKF